MFSQRALQVLARLLVVSREVESLLMFVWTLFRGVHLGSGDFVFVSVHILSTDIADAGDFVDGVVHICLEEYRRYRRHFVGGVVDICVEGCS